MRVWIVNPYGTLPGEGWRDYRSLMLARALVARGIEVRWFLSNFVHRSKTFRSLGVQHQVLDGNAGQLLATTLPTTRYDRNISWQRVRYEQSFGSSFSNESALHERPDVVVLADPSLFYSAPVVRYCRENGVKLVLDVIDLWPELFGVVLPAPLKSLQRLIFAPLYRRRQRLVEATNAVVAVTGDYLETVCPALTYPSKPRLASYWGVDLQAFADQAQRPAGAALVGDFGVGTKLLVVYAGTLGDAYDMDILVAAMRRVDFDQLPIRFVVAGDGPRLPAFTHLAIELPSTLRFLGPVDARDLAGVYAKCHVGLMSYVRGSTVSMPIKFYDYLAGGLAVVNSLGREAGEFVQRRGVGLNYAAQELDSLMNALKELSDSPTLLKESRTNARVLAQEFDSARQHDHFAALVEQLVVGAASA